MKPFEHWHRMRTEWAVQTFYQRFESVVALALTALISLVILVALYRLAHGVISGLIAGAFDPLDHKAFQDVFGDILTLLIALLALARKFIILDIRETSAQQLFGLAAVTLVVGLTYWLMREKDERAHRSRSERIP